MSKPWDLVESLPQMRQKLKNIIKEKGIVFGNITLSSKKKSDFYYDIRTVVNSEGVVLIGQLMFAKIKELFPGTKSVGGLESGALPVTTAIVYCSNQLREGRLTGFFVRNEAKRHGLQKKIEGIVNTPLVIVDDVVTTGQSAMDAVEALNAEGITPSGIISVMDREDESNMLKNGKIKFNSLFKHSEFKNFIKSKKEEQEIS